LLVPDSTTFTPRSLPHVYTLSLHDALPICLRGDTLLWYSSALTQYADLHQHIPTAKQALELLNSNFPHSQHRSKASAQLVLAAIYYGQGDLNNAIPAYKTEIGRAHV